MKAKIGLLLFVVGLALFLVKKKGHFEVVERTKVSMGTLLRISLEKKNEPQIQELFKKADEIESRLSSYKTDSELSELNKNKSLQNPSKILKRILQQSVDYYHKTQGLFNVGIGQWTDKVYEMKKWHSNEDQERIERIQSRLNKNKKMISDLGIKIDKSKIELSPEVSLDLGGIGKGFAIEEMVKSLPISLSHGVLQLSGDIFCFHRCIFSIRVPQKDQKEGLLKLQPKIKKISISTSGNYEKKLNDEIHHLINPYTLRPSKVFRSVTLVAKNQNTKLDALATGIATGHLKHAQSILKNTSIGAFLITEDQKIYINSYFYELVSILDWKGLKKEFKIIQLDKE